MVGVGLYLQTGGAYSAGYFQCYLSAAWVPDEVDEALQAALSSWMNENHEADVPAVIPATPTVDDVPQLPTIVTTAEPAAVTDIRVRARLKHKEHSEAKATLNQMCKPEIEDRYTDAERYEVAARIMREIIPALDGYYDSIREYEATGEVPKKEESNVVQETVRKMQRVQSLRSKVSRYPKKIDAAAPENKKKLQREHVAAEQELTALCEELGLG